MVMVKKASVKKSGSKAFFTKYWPVLLFVIILLAAGGVYGYNKYLDRQNVADMKQLLADFEKLKTDIESETGEKLYIEASCGSVGKFATSYACSLSLNTKSPAWNESYTKIILDKQNSLQLAFGHCEMLSENSIGFDRDKYICIFSVRKSNITTTEQVFYKYDTSPGSPV